MRRSNKGVVKETRMECGGVGGFGDVLRLARLTQGWDGDAGASTRRQTGRLAAEAHRIDGKEKAGRPADLGQPAAMAEREEERRPN